MLVDDRAHPFEMDFLSETVLARGIFATEKLNQLAGESFVIWAVALRGLEVGSGQRLMLAVFVPIVRPQGEKDTYGNGDDLEEQVDKFSSMFSAAQTHGRDLCRGLAGISSFQVEGRALSLT
ncbi:MAG: hypothetical protein DMF03_03290 [Verrucomicrobia bacterium]|nr:MAG: hypothetical protein DMF03_03290 [Verrucomicrobiota bacterium]